MSTRRIRGLIAAPHTPFHADGSLKPEGVDAQARFLSGEGVHGVFVCGATGEFASLSMDERLQLQTRWLEVGHDAGLDVIVHVGGNDLRASVELARRAAAGGADAIAAIAPSFFRPASVEELVDCCATVAAGAPETPFFYYEIPVLTHVRLPMDEFMGSMRERVPSFAGLKFTNPDLVQLQKCVELAGEELSILYGEDESLLAALELGVHGAVGSTYNFAAGLYLRLKRAFDAGERELARSEQRCSIRLVELLAARGYMGSAKRVMGFLDVDVGPPRLPLRDVSEASAAELRAELEAVEFFEWRVDTGQAPAW